MTSFGRMSPAAIKPEIDFKTFESIDIRVGTIEAVHDVASSQKLVRLVVNFGDHSRTILAGMKKERDVIEEIVGKQALFVVNLPPRTMAGETSEGIRYRLRGWAEAGAGCAGAASSERIAGRLAPH